MSAVRSLASDPVEGRAFDERYVLRRELGRGGICVVHEAMHRFTERRVAIKSLLPEYVKSEEAATRLLQEATAIGRVRHPCVVEAYDAGWSAGAPYLVMELLEGSRSLEGLLAARGKLSVREALLVMRRVSDAIAVAHEAGVIHRDIKPGNVLLARMVSPDDPSKKQTYVKVIDFGLATLARGPEALRKITKVETVLGTPEYMSLERLTATDDRQPASDVYALGVTLYECLAGTVPFPGNYAQVLRGVATGQLESLEKVRPDVPKAVAEVVHKALARDASARYPHARALCVALDLATSALGEELGGRLVAPVVEASQRKHGRAPYITPVRVTLEGVAFDARSEDVSEGGVLVLAPRAFPLGTRGEIRFALPVSGAVVTAKAVVRWAKDNKDNPRAPCALGLELVDSSEMVKDEIAKYVRHVGTTSE